MKKQMMISGLISLSIICSAADSAKPATVTAAVPAAAKKAETPKTAPKPVPENTAKPPAPAAVPPVPKVGTTLPFHAGTVYSAEISKVKPSIQDENQFDDPKFSGIENPVWAEVVVKLDQGRKLSRFDYVLVSDSGTYPCIAVAEKDNSYSMKQDSWILSKTIRGAFYRMLFALKEKEYGSAPIVQLSLKYQLKETSLPPDTIGFRIMPEGKPFSMLSFLKTKTEGTCNLSFDDMMNPAKPAVPAKKEEPKKPVPSKPAVPAKKEEPKKPVPAKPAAPVKKEEPKKPVPAKSAAVKK